MRRSSWNSRYVSSIDMQIRTVDAAVVRAIIDMGLCNRRPNLSPSMAREQGDIAWLWGRMGPCPSWNGQWQA